MPMPIDLTGERFGKWTVLHRDGRTSSGNALWVCRCDCGTERSVTGTRLRSGLATRCQRCACRESATRHGHTAYGRRSGTHRSWGKMVDRCENPNHVHYGRYGVAGVGVCERWRESFSAFLEDMGERPDGTSIDRIDNNGDYEPGNCRWATPREQANNRKTNRIVMFDGSLCTLAEACTQANMDYDKVHMRIVRGWTATRALTTPFRSYSRTGNRK